MDDTHICIWRPWKQFSNFQDPSSTLSVYVQNCSTIFTLDVHFRTNPPPLQMITNQWKENMIQGWLSCVITILSGFSLTSFHLAEASLSAFSWIYILVCAVVQKYHKLSFIYNYAHFSAHFAINLLYLHNLNIEINYGTTTAPYM